jgi:hypothetical protein
MFDGWGRRIDYIMDYRFANNDTNTANAAACTGNTNDPCFRDATAGTITVANRTTGAVYVLLSHGENGHGAFTKNGSTTRINGFPPGNPYRIDSADEFTNAKFSNLGANTPYTATFVMRDYTRVDDVGGVPRVYFDDQVRFKEKQQVIFATGAKIYQPECKTALDVVNGTGSACTGVSDVTQCQTFATEINSRCIQ